MLPVSFRRNPLFVSRHQWTAQLCPLVCRATREDENGPLDKSFGTKSSVKEKNGQGMCVREREEECVCMSDIEREAERESLKNVM